MATRTCWNCGKDAHHTLRSTPVRETGPVQAENIWSGFFQCDVCGYASIGQMSIRKEAISPRERNRTLTETQADSTVLGAVSARLDAPRASPTWLPHRSLGRRFDD